SVSKLIFNLDPGSSTEVIALFDMDLIAEGKVGARSLHVFVAAPDAVEDDSDDIEVPVDVAPSGGKWAIAAVLLALLLVAMGIAYVKRSTEGEIARTSTPTLTVAPQPAGAEVRLNGQPI